MVRTGVLPAPGWDQHILVALSRRVCQAQIDSRPVQVSVDCRHKRCLQTKQLLQEQVALRRIDSVAQGRHLTTSSATAWTVQCAAKKPCYRSAAAKRQSLLARAVGVRGPRQVRFDSFQQHLHDVAECRLNSRKKGRALPKPADGSWKCLLLSEARPF